jgi:uncharacterized protein
VTTARLDPLAGVRSSTVRWRSKTVEGHLWTIVPGIRWGVRRSPIPAAEPWSVTIDDARIGPIVLSGFVRHERGADTLVLVVHGLGGDASSPYCERAAAAAARRGWSCLRVALRGADGRGEDVYHAGLSSDLDAVLASPDLAAYRRIVLLGYSLGGHVVLRHALRPTDARVRAVAAVCAPLDLARSCEAIDRRRSLLYRHYVLRSLKRSYRTVAARRPVFEPARVIDRVRTIRAWDAAVVVPRHGFDSVDHYYATQSVGPRLRELDVSALWIGSRFDPMVPLRTVEPSLRAAGSALDVHVLEHGGHVGFPAFVLEGRHEGLEEHALRWLDRA